MHLSLSNQHFLDPFSNFVMYDCMHACMRIRLDVLGGSRDFSLGFEGVHVIFHGFSFRFFV